MATRVNRAATASQKKGGRSKSRDRTTRSVHTHESLDTPRNQRVFLEHVQENKARQHNATTGEPTRRAPAGGYGLPAMDWALARKSRALRVKRVGDPAEDEGPKFRKKKAVSGRGISGGRIFESATGDRPKPKRSGWSRG